MVAISCLALYGAGRAGIEAWGPPLAVLAYLAGMLLVLPRITGDPATFPDRGRVSAMLEELRDRPAGENDTHRSELITRTLRGFEALFDTRAYFLDPLDRPRLLQAIPVAGSPPALITRPLGAAARRYRDFALGLPDEGLFFPSGATRPGLYRPRGIPGDYFLPLNSRNETAGVICLRRGSNFSRRERTLLRGIGGNIALVLRTAGLREQVRVGQEDLRRREKNLARMEGMTRSLLNHITREIARPIDDIESNALRLSAAQADASSSTNRIQKLHLLAHQVSALLEDSLLLVELESGTYHLQIGTENVSQILREALLEARMKLPDSRIEIELGVDKDAVAAVDRYLLSSAAYRLFRTIRLIPRHGRLRIVQESSAPLVLAVSLETPDESGPGRIHHLNQLYPYLQTFTKTMNKSLRLMGSRLEFRGNLDRILSIRFPAGREAEESSGV